MEMAAAPGLAPEDDPAPAMACPLHVGAGHAMRASTSTLPRRPPPPSRERCEHLEGSLPSLSLPKLVASDERMEGLAGRPRERERERERDGLDIKSVGIRLDSSWI